MNSIGEKLRAAREAKRLTIKDVVKDTNINPLYIDALEEEDFDKFPSETYIIGFLRSYTEYLKLDTDEIIQAYKGYKIGESITPIEELTKPTKPSFLSCPLLMSMPITIPPNVKLSIGNLDELVRSIAPINSTSPLLHKKVMILIELIE